MKLKIWGGVYGASRLVNGCQNFHYTSATLNCGTEEEALGVLLKAAHRQFPHKEGYFSHFSQAAEVTEKQIKAYLNS